jgi:hypothetical protein
MKRNEKIIIICQYGVIMKIVKIMWKEIIIWKWNES